MTGAQLLTPRQVAAWLAFKTPRPIYRMIREGTLPASRIGGRLLIDRDDVDALIAASHRGPQVTPGGLLELERSA